MAANAVIQTLRHVWLTVRPLQLPVAVMGGLALANWKHFRATRDVDLLIALDNPDPARLLKCLDAAAIRPKNQTQPQALKRLGHLELLQVYYEPPEAFLDVQIDLLLACSDYHRQALSRRLPVQLPDLDVEIAVLSCEDMILHKLLAERMIDLADAVALLQNNRERLDFEYLAKWSRELQIEPAFAKARADASRVEE